MKQRMRIILLVLCGIFVILILASTQSKFSASELDEERHEKDFLQGMRVNRHLKPTVDNFYSLQKTQVTNMNYSIILEPRDFCSENTKIVFFSPSPASHAKSRQVTRVTWGRVVRKPRWPLMKHSLPELKLFFVVAQSEIISDAELETEHEMYNDLLYIGFKESYRNLTLKSLFSLRWLWRHCSQASFFVKADEDQFVFVPQLILDLRPFSNQSNLIIGSYNDRSLVLHNQNAGKWDVPEEVFPFASFPPYMAGPLYAMTADVAAVTSRVAPFVFPVHLEDVFITGIIPKIAKIHHALVSSFTHIPGLKPSACSMTLFELVAMEMRNDSEKLDLWRDFVEANRTESKLCQREISRRSEVRWNHNGPGAL